MSDEIIKSKVSSLVCPHKCFIGDNPSVGKLGSNPHAGRTNTFNSNSKIGLTIHSGRYNNNGFNSAILNGYSNSNTSDTKQAMPVSSTSSKQTKSIAETPHSNPCISFLQDNATLAILNCLPSPTVRSYIINLADFQHQVNLTLVGRPGNYPGFSIPNG